MRDTTTGDLFRIVVDNFNLLLDLSSSIPTVPCITRRH